MGLRAWLFGNAATNNGSSATRSTGDLNDLVGRVESPTDLDGALPGPVVAFGDSAFGISAGSQNGQPITWIAGATTPGGGRLLAVGHDGLFAPTRLKNTVTETFVRELISWLANSHSDVEVIGPNSKRVTDALRQWGLRTTETSHSPTANLCVVHADALDDNPTLVSELTDALTNGRSVWVHSTPWGWEQITEGDLRTDHGGNALVQRFGLCFASDTVDIIPTRSLTHFPVELHAGRARERLIHGGASDNDATLVTVLLGGLHPENPFRASLASDFDVAPHAISAQRPITQSNHRERIGARLWLDHATLAPAIVHQETAPSIEILVPPGTWGWISTNREARPGEQIEVGELNPGSRIAAGQEWQVRIGSQTDELWHLPSWSRFPAITSCAAADGPQCSTKNPFGGIIYVDVAMPSDRERRFRVTGGIAAHRFVLGNAEANANWSKPIERNGYAEIEGKRFVLTVPSNAIVDRHDPTGVCNYFDAMLDTCADLAGINSVRGRKERYVCDVQISHGYLHAGYPMMGHLDMVPVWTSEKRLRAYDQNGSWAMFHETGHNHQDRAWTPSGTGEVTCNLFSLYCAQQLHGITEQAHGALAKARVQAAVHKRNGAPFATWKSDPFLALQTYRELIYAYGWDTLKAVIASYSDPSFGPRPATDPDRYDTWAVRYSRVTGHDLSGHFTGWGIPLSSAAVSACRRPR
jgi:Peptidase M60, enhancin and enhancin-like/N-terminal domain of M60-like peptidases